MSEVIVEGVAKYADVSDKTYGQYKNHKHDITVDGTRYSAFHKSDKPFCNPGDTVKFEASQNDKGYWNINPKKFKVLERGKGHQQQAPSGGGADERQSSILRQSSVNYATNLVSAMITQGRFDSLSDEEVVEHTIYLADSYILPYTSEGKKPEGKEPVSDFDGGDQSDDWDSDGDNEPPF